MIRAGTFGKLGASFGKSGGQTDIHNFSVLSSAGVEFVVPRDVKSSSGSEFVVEGDVLDSDGNRFNPT